MQNVTVHEALRWASSFLSDHQCEEKVAEILLLHELNWTKTDFVSSLREKMDTEKYRSFQQKIKQHETTKVPVQHITGVEVFYGRNFHVNPHVLIPRPETEELIQHVVAEIQGTHISCVDVGTGSGIIAITLAKEWKKQQVEIFATDLSNEALEVAKQNASIHEASINFYQGDFLTPLIEKRKKVDVIISNPPYIAYDEADHLSDTVKNYDPKMALFAENNGLAAYEQIIEQARFVVNEQARMFFEIGHTQADAVSSFIRRYFPNSHIDILQDINGKDRIISAKLNNE